MLVSLAFFELPYVAASTPAVLYVPWGIVVDLLFIITTPSIWRVMLPTGQRVAASAALTIQIAAAMSLDSLLASGFAWSWRSRA